MRGRGALWCAWTRTSQGATAARIAGDLDRLGIAHAFLPPYPGGAKDADEWLMAERGGAWEFEFAERFPGDDRPLARTRWIDGG